MTDRPRPMIDRRPREIRDPAYLIPVENWNPRLTAAQISTMVVRQERERRARDRVAALALVAWIATIAWMSDGVQGRCEDGRLRGKPRLSLGAERSATAGSASAGSGRDRPGMDRHGME